MKDLRLSADSTSEEVAPFALAVHSLAGLPVTMRSLNKKGVQIEKGEVLDYDYTGPILERVLKENRVIRAIPKSGKYQGTPVIVSPIRNKDGEVIAAVGIVDVIGIIDLASLCEAYPHIVQQVSDYFKKLKD
ncbi:MAG: DUF2111 domain-containing protein [Methanosarcinales archaeon]